MTRLEDDAAWAELRGHDIGRLAVSFAGEPEIFPVNFVVDQTSAVFLTAEGTKLLAATVGVVAVFEVDRVDAAGATSVIVRGPLREITDPDELAAARELPLQPWVPTYKTHYLRLDATSIGGRRFRFGEAPLEPSQDG